MPTQQTYANHVRWFPLFHFVVVPLLLLNLIYQSVRLYQEPSWDHGMWVVLALALILMNFAARLQALKSSGSRYSAGGAFEISRDAFPGSRRKGA